MNIIYSIAGVILAGMLGFMAYQHFSYNTLENKFEEQSAVVETLRQNVAAQQTQIMSMELSYDFLERVTRNQQEAMIDLQQEVFDNRGSITRLKAVRDVNDVEEVAKTDIKRAEDIIQGAFDEVYEQIRVVTSSDIDD